MEIYNKVKPKEKQPIGRPTKFTNKYMMMIVNKMVNEGMIYREVARIFDYSPEAF